MVIAPQLFLDLHSTIQFASGDAGAWKNVDNEIVELRPGLPPLIRFRPLSARETPDAVAELCLAYRHVVDQRLVQPLVAAAAFVLDFLCTHPFRDGNGRVSRLITLITLYHQGIEVGRYISLERTIEESREDYYEALRQSSQGWHEGRHDIVPWLNYILSVVRRAYKEFEERAGQVRSPRGAKRELVELAISNRGGSFTLVELERLCPGVSRDMIRRVLWELKRHGKIECVKRGPAAEWRRVANRV
jgi:Fic family protein